MTTSKKNLKPTMTKNTLMTTRNQEGVKELLTDTLALVDRLLATEKKEDLERATKPTEIPQTMLKKFTKKSSRRKVKPKKLLK